MKARQTYSILALSKAIPADRNTLSKYLGIPGAPRPNAKGLYSLKEVRSWLLRSAPRAGEPPATRSLRARKLTLLAERAEAELTSELKRYAIAAETIAAFRHTIAIMEDLTRKALLIDLPPRWANCKTIPELQDTNERAINACFHAVNERYDELRQQAGNESDHVPKLTARPLPKTTDKLRLARARRMAAEVGLLELTREVRRGKFVELDAFKTTFTPAMQTLNADILTQVIDILPQQHKGRSTAEIVAGYKAQIDRIFGTLERQILEFQDRSKS